MDSLIVINVLKLWVSPNESYSIVPSLILVSVSPSLLFWPRRCSRTEWRLVWCRWTHLWSWGQYNIVLWILSANLQFCWSHQNWSLSFNFDRWYPVAYPNSFSLGLAGSIGTMFCTLRTSPDNTIPKYAFWLAFNACQAATLSPLYFYSPVLLSKAALYTLGIVGSLSYVGATAKTNQYLYMGGPLLAGVSVVALSSLAPLVLPVTAARTLMATEAISLYGGLAVFSGFVLYE